jgi:hypothetical protein
VSDVVNARHAEASEKMSEGDSERSEITFTNRLLLCLQASKALLESKTTKWLPVYGSEVNVNEMNEIT